MDYSQKSLNKHKEWQGKIEVVTRCPIKTREDLSLAYTPGVAAPCLAIKESPALSYKLTRRANLVAVVTDGSAVLGLGNIGPEAGMPVMEGKCALFKEFADVDAFPLCIRTNDVDEIVRTVYLLSSSFGGVNLEDIAAPRCFEIEEKLKALCDIPIFHDDQHGTAIVVAAALMNAAKVVGKPFEALRVVINGAGSAGIAIAKHLLKMGVRDILAVDKCGVLSSDIPYENPAHQEIARLTNPRRIHGTLADAMVFADAFIGVSAPKLVTKDMIRSMAEKPIVFAMANPTPEIMPEDAKAAGAAVLGTGRSDYPNQINNLLAFPGVFRGALDCFAREINEEMKVAASMALAGYIPENELTSEAIIPSPLDKKVAFAVAEAVKEAAIASGVSRLTTDRTDDLKNKPNGKGDTT